MAALPFTAADRERVNAVLIQAGALGAEEREAHFIAYFPDQPAAALQAALQDLMRRARVSATAAQLEIARIPEEDWAVAWRRFFKPVSIRGGLVIRPPWEKPSPPSGGLEIVIAPKQAFGTGSHATTRLMLQAIVDRRHALPGRALDLGTGSGILAIAHACFNPRARITAIDIDPVAIDNARENAAHNRVARQIDFVTGEVGDLEPGLKFPLIYANLQTHIIFPALGDILCRLAAGGRLLVSGVLDTEEKGMCKALQAHRLRISGVEKRDEWLRIDVLQEPAK